MQRAHGYPSSRGKYPLNRDVEFNGLPMRMKYVDLILYTNSQVLSV